MLTVYLLVLAHASKPACDVRAAPYHAVGDNKTDDTAVIQQAIDECDEIVLSNNGPNTAYRITSSLALKSDLTFRIEANTSLFSAQPLCDPKGILFPACRQHPLCPTLYWKTGPTAILCGTNLTNVAVVGADPLTSIVDGGGWPWYEAGWFNKQSSITGVGPRAYELAWSKNLTLSKVGFHWSPSWTVHPTFCDGVLADEIHILNPRAVGNTDGFDPDSSVNVVLRHSVIDTGDDGISIKSSNSSEPGSSHIMMPSRNTHIYNSTILSRNVCLGSATYGGIYDLVVEDCTIGDEDGSSPWAIKYKSHQSYPGTLKNHTWRRLRVGKIWPNSYQQPNGGYFMSVELKYHPLIPNRTCHEWDCPTMQDVTFEDIVITTAKRAGDINGFPGALLKGLTFRNVTFKELPAEGWQCGFVDSASFVSDNVTPKLECSKGPSPPPANIVTV